MAIFSRRSAADAGVYPGSPPCPPGAEERYAPFRLADLTLP